MTCVSFLKCSAFSNYVNLFVFSNKRYSWFLVVFYGVVWCQILLFLALQNWFIPFLCFQANLNLDMEIKKLETSVWFDNATAHYKKIVSTDPQIFLLIIERLLTRLNSSIFLKYKFLIYTNVRLWRIWFSLLMDRPDWMFWNHSFWLVFDLLPIWENEVSPLFEHRSFFAQLFSCVENSKSLRHFMSFKLWSDLIHSIRSGSELCV